MSRASLSLEASEVFRENLRTLKADFALSLNGVGRVVGCCRKTAWTLLHRSAETKVRRRYAANLARHLGITGAAPWDHANPGHRAVKSLLQAWQDADTSAGRRRVAYRLSVYAAEHAVISFGLVVGTAVSTSVTKEPVALALRVTAPCTRDTTMVVIQFDPFRRDRLVMRVTDPLQVDIYNGDLSAFALDRILTNAKAWTNYQKARA